MSADSFDCIPSKFASPRRHCMFYTTKSIIKVSSHELNNRNVPLRVIACKLFVMHLRTFTGTMLKGREEFEAA